MAGPLPGNLGRVTDTGPEKLGNHKEHEEKAKKVTFSPYIS
jgi:hypothetical protein